MQQPKILLIEDDPNLGTILEESLELQGFSVTRCEDGEEGHSVFLEGKFDLCLIDVMLPRKDGFSLARDIRKTDENIPIIFLTAKSMKEDRIEGFRIGGDDYITKPFSMEELFLRIQAVLKRSTKDTSVGKEQNQFSIGDYIFDYERHVLSFQQNKRRLTSKESELLRLLCLHLNQTLEREVALKMIWGDDSFFAGRSMDVYVSKLRKYLKEDGRVEIMNVHGKGFKLVVR
jgi:two-component system response regulator VicR